MQILLDVSSAVIFNVFFVVCYLVFGIYISVVPEGLFFLLLSPLPVWYLHFSCARRIGIIIATSSLVFIIATSSYVQLHRTTRFDVDLWGEKPTLGAIKRHLCLGVWSCSSSPGLSLHLVCCQKLINAG